jgi:cobaltochelatase CobT
MAKNLQTPSIEQAESSVLKVLSNKKGANVTFNKNSSVTYTLHNESLSISQPYLKPTDGQIAAIRGMVDSAALELKYHNKHIHAKYAPDKEDNITIIYNAAERARFESIGSNQMLGISKNIDKKIIYEFLHHDYENNQNDQTKVIEAIATTLYLLLRKTLTNQELPNITTGLIKTWEKLVNSKLLKYKESLLFNIHNQEEFSKLLVNLMNDFDLNLNQKHINDDKDEVNKEKNEIKINHQPPEDISLSSKKIEHKKTQETYFAEDILAVESESNTNKADNISPIHVSSALKTDIESYKIYTSEFDQIIKAESFYDKKELIYLRKQLDDKFAQLKSVNRRSANLFLRKLLSHHSRSWDYNLEYGILDGRKLSTLIADPNYLEYFKQEKESDNNNTIVTLLLDNSGSMRGRPITVAAMGAEIIAKTLEACGIKVEILGFTTAQWKGGQSRKKWQSEGGSKNPGRLNDLHHIIYKSAETPWRKARNNLGVMLKEGILKENIDGEAILWACKRLSIRHEKRRILMVISDGAPVDDSTLSTNSSLYLENHLKDVIKFIEQKSDIELVAIGIGHDVGRYYSKATTIKDIDELESTMFNQLTKILADSKIVK